MCDGTHVGTQCDHGGATNAGGLEVSIVAVVIALRLRRPVLFISGVQRVEEACRLRARDVALAAGVNHRVKELLAVKTALEEHLAHVGSALIAAPDEARDGVFPELAAPEQALEVRESGARASVGRGCSLSRCSDRSW